MGNPTKRPTSKGPASKVPGTNDPTSKGPGYLRSDNGRSGHKTSDRNILIQFCRGTVLCSCFLSVVKGQFA
jgi:hypothetical protein